MIRWYFRRFGLEPKNLATNFFLQIFKLSHKYMIVVVEKKAQLDCLYSNRHSTFAHESVGNTCVSVEGLLPIFNAVNLIFRVVDDRIGAEFLAIDRMFAVALADQIDFLRVVMLGRLSHAGRKFQDAWAEAMAKCAVGVDQKFAAHSICTARPGIRGASSRCWT